MKNTITNRTMRYIYYINHDKFKPKATVWLSDEVGQFERFRGKDLRIFFFYIHWEKYSFWFRLCDYGISGRKIGTYKPYFSERNGLRKFYDLRGWRFEVLKPFKS